MEACGTIRSFRGLVSFCDIGKLGNAAAERNAMSNQVRFPFNAKYNLPIILVTFTGPDDAIEIETLVDTGASRVLIGPDLGRLLGYEFGSRQADGHTEGTGGKQSDYWKRPAGIRLDDGSHVFEWSYPEIGITNAKLSFPILGWRGCLDFFTVTFEANPKRIAFEQGPHFPGDFV